MHLWEPVYPQPSIGELAASTVRPGAWRSLAVREIAHHVISVAATSGHMRRHGVLALAYQQGEPHLRGLLFVPPLDVSSTRASMMVSGAGYALREIPVFWEDQLTPGQFTLPVAFPGGEYDFSRRGTDRLYSVPQYSLGYLVSRLQRLAGKQ